MAKLQVDVTFEKENGKTNIAKVRPVKPVRNFATHYDGRIFDSIVKLPVFGGGDWGGEFIFISRKNSASETSFRDTLRKHLSTVFDVRNFHG